MIPSRATARPAVSAIFPSVVCVPMTCRTGVNSPGGSTLPSGPPWNVTVAQGRIEPATARAPPMPIVNGPSSSFVLSPTRTRQVSHANRTFRDGQEG